MCSHERLCDVPRGTESEPNFFSGEAIDLVTPEGESSGSQAPWTLHIVNWFRGPPTGSVEWEGWSWQRAAWRLCCPTGVWSRANLIRLSDGPGPLEDNTSGEMARCHL